MNLSARIRDALEREPDELQFQVDGLEIHGLEWKALTGESQHAPLILLHGGAAHAGWWAHLAPNWCEGRGALALDLSGHGDSAWRPIYPRRTWAEEVATVVRDGSYAPAILIGHSMGGLVGIVAASLFPELWSGLIVIDAPVRPGPVREVEAIEEPSRAESTPGQGLKHQVYRDVDSALSRFRLIPPQPEANPELLARVARASLRSVPGGVSWKFDPRFIVPAQPEDMSAHLSRVRCPIHLIRGANSALVTDEVLEHMRRLLPDPSEVTTIAGGYHHVLLDHPDELTDAVRDVLARWHARGIDVDSSPKA